MSFFGASLPTWADNNGSYFNCTIFQEHRRRSGNTKLKPVSFCIALSLHNLSGTQATSQ